MELLEIEDSVHFDQARKALIAGDELRPFQEYFEASPDKDKIVAFARRQGALVIGPAPALITMHSKMDHFPE